MAGEVKNVLTNAGRNLIAAAIGEERKVLVFSRAEVGTGDYRDLSPAKEMEEMTALAVPFGNAVVSKKSAENGAMVLMVQFINTGVHTNPIQIMEIGVYAQLKDPTTGQAIAGSEALFSYMTFGNTPDLVLAVETALVQRVYDIPFVLNGRADIEVIISSSGMITNADTLSSALPAGSGNAGKVVRLNANGKLDADIMGDANTLDGHDSTYFSPVGHDHNDATEQTHGYMSAADKARHNQMSGWMNQDLKKTATPTFAGLTVNGYIDGAKFR